MCVCVGGACLFLALPSSFLLLHRAQTVRLNGSPGVEPAAAASCQPGAAGAAGALTRAPQGLKAVTTQLVLDSRVPRVDSCEGWNTGGKVWEPLAR